MDDRSADKERVVAENVTKQRVWNGGTTGGRSSMHCESTS